MLYRWIAPAPVQKKIKIKIIEILILTLPDSSSSPTRFSRSSSSSSESPEQRYYWNLLNRVLSESSTRVANGNSGSKCLQTDGAVQSVPLTDVRSWTIAVHKCHLCTCGVHCLTVPLRSSILHKLNPQFCVLRSWDRKLPSLSLPSLSPLRPFTSRFTQ